MCYVLPSQVLFRFLRPWKAKTHQLALLLRFRVPQLQALLELAFRRLHGLGGSPVLLQDGVNYRLVRIFFIFLFFGQVTLGPYGLCPLAGVPEGTFGVLNHIRHYCASRNYCAELASFRKAVAIGNGSSERTYTELHQCN